MNDLAPRAEERRDKLRKAAGSGKYTLIRRSSVWALSISLAATLKIDVSFSSSGYLDVSVHRVPLLTLWIGVRMTGVFPAGFPHSDIYGSLDICS